MRVSSLIMVAILGAGLYYWFALRVPDETTGKTPSTAPTAIVEPTAQENETAVPVMVLSSSARETTDILTLRARTKANRFVSVPAETAGLVISEPLRRGARIEKDQLLCRLAPGARQAQLAEAEARLAEAMIEADAAATLSKKGFTAETTMMARTAQLQAAQAAVDLVKLDIKRLEIRAPFSGVLESDTAELGSRLGIGDPCARIIDLSVIKVAGFASEQVVDKIYLGQTTRVRLINGREATGSVTFISTMSDEDTRTYEIEATLDNQEGTIRDGMTAEMLIELPAEAAHLIPKSALTLNDSGTLGVRLAVDGHTVFHEVRVLRDEQRGVWVVGLPATTKIIVVGQEFVRDGRSIVPTEISWDDLG